MKYKMTNEAMKEDRYIAKGDKDGISTYFSIKEDTTHQLVAKFLVDDSDGAIYSKPAEKLAQAVELVWSALNGLDSWRLKVVFEEYPEFFRIGQLYRDVYQSPNRCLLTDIKRMEAKEDV